MSAPASGLGTVVLLTNKGVVYGWDDTAGGWSQLFQTGLEDDYGQIKISPNYNPLGVHEREKQIVVATSGKLWISRDWGTQWYLNGSFSNTAVTPADWVVSAISMSVNFVNDGTILVAQSRENPSAGTPWGDEGEVWRSTDGGNSFSMVRVVESRITALHATGGSPVGPSHFYMSIFYYPELANPSLAVGIRRSDNGGLTWNDFGNWQDFLLEPEVAGGAAQRWKPLMAFAESTDFQNDGVIYFGRSEGVFRSDDSGNHWVQTRTRSERFIRHLAVGLDANQNGGNDVVVFGGSYGSGTLMARFREQNGSLNLIETTTLADSKITYQKPVVVSPNYSLDGVMVAGGSNGLAIWFDPNRNGKNQYGARGWVETDRNPYGYVRTLAISPHFDASTPQSTDRSFFWSTRSDLGAVDEQTWRTLDCGQTTELIDTCFEPNSNSHVDLPHLSNMVVASTYDAVNNVTDVYGSAGPNLFRFGSDPLGGTTPVWTWLGSTSSRMSALALDPDWELIGTPGYRRIWATLVDPPYLAALDDLTSGLVVQEITTTGMDSEVKGLAVPSTFSTTSVLFASTTGMGVKSLDVSPFLANPQASCSWQQTGKNYPAYVTLPIVASPNFASDGTLFTGTDFGIVWGQDNASVAWQLADTPGNSDDRDPGYTFYSPNAQSNPAPNRPWDWDESYFYKVENKYGVETHGTAVSWTTDHGAWFRWEGVASEVSLETFTGSLMGSVTVEVMDFWTGSTLATATENLNGGPIANHLITLPLLASAEVIVKVTADLSGPNAVAFAFDGLMITP